MQTENHHQTRNVNEKIIFKIRSVVYGLLLKLCVFKKLSIYTSNSYDIKI